MENKKVLNEKELEKVNGGREASDSRNYVCSKCGASFKTALELKEHKNSLNHF